MIAGIAWIGSSFYFVHLDASLKRRAALPEGAGGEAWQIHGGGFYHMVKYLIDPNVPPLPVWGAVLASLAGLGLGWLL